MQKLLMTCCLTGGALLLAPPDTLAQTDTASKATSDKKPVTKAQPVAEPPTTPSVTVAGERPTNRIDRQVYDVKSDVSSTNGTAADALNNVPSVAVDPDGSVTLRGSSNVQILVDGKPSAMLQGENRGAALQAMAADDIESVEVINNPGAQFGNEAGGGPILNLVMRRNRKPGGFATVNGNAGTAGRYNSAVNGTYNEGPWGFQGSANVRHDGRNSTAEVTRERLDPATGAFVPSSQSSVSRGLNDMAGVNGTVSYNLGTTDTLTGSANYSSRGNDQRSTDHYLNGATALIPASDYVRTTARSGDSKNFGWGGRYDHKGELPGETLKIDLRVSASENDSDSAYANDYLGDTQPDTRANQHSNNSVHIVDFTGDYERPLAGGSLKAGYKAATNTSSFDTLYTDIDTVTGAARVNMGRTNSYELEETTLALYGSYQMRLNDRWGALAGLRAEYTDMDIHQITGNVEAKNNYINYIPSFFATYKATETANMRFAYARRIRRPNANDLNPYVTYRDEFNVSSGNPNLKPTKTDSFEVGYETKMYGLETNLRGYYRRDTDAIVDYRTFIGNNVLLTTKQNGEGSHSSGLEFTVSGKLTPSLTLNTSGNLARSEQTTQDSTGALVTRTANSLSGRARLNYQYNAANQIQMALQMMGKTLSGQGYRSPNHTFNMSWRHTVTPQLSLVANVTDLFNTNKMETVVNSSTLRETSTRRFDGRVLYVGLSYRFGGASSSGESKDEPPRFGPGRGPGGPGGPGAPGGPSPDA
ncbi:outer membrane beta-barrel family protein [Duganella aceris]|uniref:TonB-dependent receptor n=1 Tax=Duganella aceris TaxID=2703883 RepID=A0ABX0FJQ3_9BURK|nr:outer membrane beta-barrel family protein [Duganella aceris]NGZ84805.1 TonB-dependent receptor [Duganella aceris]